MGLRGAAILVSLAMIAASALNFAHHGEKPAAAATLAATAGAASPLAVIPTSYPVPADAIFVAPGGNDGDAGTMDAPLRTAAAAVAKAAPGRMTTIVLRAGEYRERLGNVAAPVTLQPYPGEQVWFKGSAEIQQSRLTADRGAWRLDGWNPGSVCRASAPAYDECMNPLHFNDDNPVGGDPQMVFVDGEPLRQVAIREEVKAGTFFHDGATDRTFIGSDPTGRRVEITARKSGMHFFAGADGSVVRGPGLSLLGSNNVRVINNTSVGNAQALAVQEDARPTCPGADDVCPTDAEKAAGITWDTANITLVNNVLAGDTSTAPLVNTTDNNTAESGRRVGADGMIPAAQMHHNGYSRTAADTPATLVQWSRVTGSSIHYTSLAWPDEPAKIELVRNGTLEGPSITPWWSAGNPALTVDNGELRAAVAGGAAEPGDAVVTQQTGTLIAGRTYTVSFDARASADVAVQVAVQEGEAPNSDAHPLLRHRAPRLVLLLLAQPLGEAGSRSLRSVSILVLLPNVHATAVMMLVCATFGQTNGAGARNAACHNDNAGGSAHGTDTAGARREATV
ncbi:hypothetical protein HCN51_57055 [Nonomuraea sp. FMUSA5-5]|uniref:CBM-cenC domain-containing protein n=1 Tax=Nonomuraea composti TaxID=2720023 RepID=A0ABX1BQH2_9ACTN|nr:carbohydrate binding domain-containing protein [Nonomuraea sp. FMUSA5-5]NJP98834.1 hypothetical protein [Nonomuraea sp. FMUSA5-5]